MLKILLTLIHKAAEIEDLRKMFSKLLTINNGTFETMPKEIIEEISGYLDSKDNISNKFFNQLTKEQNLKREQKLFAMYSLMTKYIHPITSFECKRRHLEKQLYVSRDTFLVEVRKALSNQQYLEKMSYEKQFADIILSPDGSETALNNAQESIHSFLYSLCFIQGTNALDIFIKKYPNAIKELNVEEFNSLCVAAATNHLFWFMDFLCKQGKSIDEYAEVHETVIILISAKITPLVAACLGVFESPSSARIARGKKIIALLLENNADLNKQYICDDLSSKAMTDILNHNEGYSIIDVCADNINAYENKTNPRLTESNTYTKVIVDFMQYILSLKPKIIENPRLTCF